MHHDFIDPRPAHSDVTESFKMTRETFFLILCMKFAFFVDFLISVQLFTH